MLSAPVVPELFADRSRFVALDTETHLIQPGLAAPPLVCGSVAGEDYDPAILDRDAARVLFTRLLESDYIICGANIAYDSIVMAVDAARRGIDLLPAIFAKYARGEFYDVQIAEALHAIAHGHLGRDPRDGTTLRGADGKPTGRYSLLNCVKLVLGREDAKYNDDWRMSYALLEDIPIDQWPEEALTYPVDDARNTLEVALAQCGHVPRGTDGPVFPAHNLHDVAFQTYKAFSLALGAARGLRADRASVDVLMSAAQHLKEQGGTFPEFVRDDGTEDQASLKRAVAEAYGCSGSCVACAGTGKVYNKFSKRDPSKPVGQPVNCKACSATGMDLKSAAVPMTEPSTMYPAGQVKAGRDELIESGDERLMAYGFSQEDEKVITTYGVFLKEALDTPVTLRPNAVLDTGRVSYSGPVQLLPRQVSARLSAELKRRGSDLVGVRDCFSARDGCVFYSVDYSAGELTTFAESCIKRVGYSRMGEVLNSGADVHSMLGASFVNMPYEEFSKRKKEKRCKDLRQAAKPINFGCPGGIGALKIVLQQRKSGPDTPHPSGPVQVWDGGQFVPGYKGLRFCLLVDGRDVCGDQKITEYKGRACAPVCRHCVDVAERLRKGWFETWPEAEPYLKWHGENSERVGWVEQLYSRRLRHTVDGFCSEANGDFQALLADIAGHALNRVAEEQYAVKDSPLYGVSWGIVFQHDELLGECSEQHGHEVCTRVETIMVDEFKRGCPNHEAACKAESTLMKRWWKSAELVRDANWRIIPWEPKR